MVEAPAAGATELGGGGHWHGTRCHSHVIARDACPGIVPGSSSGGWGMSRDTLQGQASPGDEALSLPLQTGHWKARPRERRRAVNAHPQRMHGKKQTVLSQNIREGSRKYPNSDAQKLWLSFSW